MHWGAGGEGGNEEAIPESITTQWAETVLIFKALQGSVEWIKRS